MDYSYSVPAATPATNPLFALWPVFLIIIIIVVILIIYHKTVGYYINYGWTNIWNLIYNKKEVEVEIGEDGKQPLIDAKLSKFDEEKEAAAAAAEQQRQMEQDRIMNDVMQQRSMQNNMMGSDEGASGSFNPFSSSDSTPAVYNVSENIYTYYDAPAVCKALNGKLATFDQVKKAHESGADWCNYGWIKGQQAVYPTQKKTWEKLQKGPSQFASSCGKPGVNGGHFDNPELRFGVNCYGPRPPKNMLSENKEDQVALPPSTEEIEFDKKVQRYRDNINSISILPFSK